jgi:hypothetical protein
MGPLVTLDGATCDGSTCYIGYTWNRSTCELGPLVTGLVEPLGPVMQGLLETPGLTVTGHLVHGQVKVAPAVGGAYSRKWRLEFNWFIPQKWFVPSTPPLLEKVTLNWWGTFSKNTSSVVLYSISKIIECHCVHCRIFNVIPVWLAGWTFLKLKKNLSL